MTQAEYDLVVADLEKAANDIAAAKRPAYTLGGDDVLANFKQSGTLAGVTPMQAWGVLFAKQVLALCSHAKDPNIPQAEAIKGRFADALNFIKLGWALTNDNE